ncbi:myosin-6-like isoform X4 [Anopheles gambiae]|uniref:myosin-6-like isoform X4 n=2 Tax=gambiae species complex TaxID=44542 RepID=UPI002AC99117|nr:myosin-6-like isoform X4 [Anopheles gambiae]
MDSTPKCQLCNRPEEEQATMEKCCLCTKWEHAECAGLFVEIKDPASRYVCSKCKVKQETTAAKFRDDRDTASLKPSGRSKKGSVASTKRSERIAQGSVPSTLLSVNVEEQLKLVEEEKRLREREIEEKRELKRRENAELARQLEEKRKLAEEESLLRERELKAEAEMNALETSVRRESLEKKRELLLQQSRASNMGSQESYSEKVVCWLRKSEEMPGEKEREKAVSRAGSMLMNLQPFVTSSARKRTNEKTMVEERLKEQLDLSGRQIAARHVLGKEVSYFSGDLEDWPLFFSTFEETSQTCGFSNAENLIRLQRCLKGNALELVKDQLTLKENVPDILETLKMIYGKPSLLIRSLLNKIRCMSPPRPDRMRTVIEFGLSVKALTNHMRAAKLNAHLNNPTLLEELEEKLPGDMKLNWAAYQEEKAIEGLEGFSDYVSQLAKRACAVTNDLHEIARIGERRKKHTVALNTHVRMNVEEETPNERSTSSYRPPSATQRRQCAVCQREGHRVYECEQFKAADVDERWKFVNTKSLCRTCLNNHGKWPCKSWQGCGVDGCRLKHHQLLHPTVATDEAVSACASHTNEMRARHTH